MWVLKEPSHWDGSFMYPQHNYGLTENYENTLLSKRPRIDVGYCRECVWWGLKSWIFYSWLSLLASPKFCRPLQTFAYSLYPDQARQSVRPDLGTNCLTPRWYTWKNFSKKLILKKLAMKNYPVCKEIIDTVKWPILVPDIYVNP